MLSDQELLSAFTHAKFRARQWKALRDVADALDSYDDVILSAPTGGGKSALAVTLASAYKTKGLRSYITSPLVSLVRQYQNTPEFQGRFPTLVGRRNYNCDIQGDCSQRLCDALNNKMQTRDHACHYTKSFVDARQTTIMCCTLSLLLTQKPEQRDLLVVDEAHLIGDFVSSDYKVTLSRLEAATFQQNATSGPVDSPILGWIHSIRKPMEDNVKALEETFNDSSDSDLEVLRQLREAESLLVKLNALLSSNVTWVWYYSGPNLVFEPVELRQLIKKDVMRLGAKRLYMSATPPTRAELDLSDKNCALIEVPSIFPKTHRMIIVDAVGSMNYAHRDANMPAIARKIAACTQSPIPGEPRKSKTLIHISSYHMAKLLSNELDRLGVAHLTQDRQNRTQIIDIWKQSNIALLIGVRQWEGLDLRDELCRRVIWVNIPFPDSQSPVVQARIAAEGKAWYNSQAARAITQGAGRHVRHETDYGITYILDARFNWLKNNEAVPAWFRDNIFIVNSGAAPKVVKQKRKQM